jgi:hypothetical protein
MCKNDGFLCIGQILWPGLLERLASSLQSEPWRGMTNVRNMLMTLRKAAVGETHGRRRKRPAMAGTT